MAQKISRLSEDVINKIAAGEVVENPASIAKELIENSLDAGAKRIEIAAVGGGIQLLQIEDDGCGMGPEDAKLALERHATSKIRTESDLMALSTMGFRGEALAAISSVSRFELKTSDGTEGTKVEAAGGALKAEPCARRQGTTVLVRELFFNVPARKKFLKAATANTAALIRAVETIALAHEGIAFILKTDGKTALEVYPEERKRRIERVLEPMPHEAKGPGVWGLLSTPDEVKATRRGQFLFVNKRPVFSPLVSRAVKAGYGTRIPENGHPSFVLFLDVAPELVDVNVHPQKKEVRFAEEAKIFAIVEKAVASAFCNPAPVFERPLSFSPQPFSMAELPALAPRMAEIPLSFDFPMAIRPLALIDHYFFLQAERLYLVDLRLAHARVLYEALKSRREPAQSLLWPIEASVYDEGSAQELEQMGIECRLIGKGKIAVDALPSFLEPDDFPAFLRAWQEGKKLDEAASRYAAQAKRSFNLDEALLVWKQLMKCQETLYDPLGRRIWETLDAGRLKKILEGA